MPELPEVQCVVNSLQNITNYCISSVTTSNLKLRKSINFMPENLNGKTIIAITRTAKYIVINLLHNNNTSHLLVHLGMSGTLTIQTSTPTGKHNHVILTLQKNNQTVYLVYNDPRRFGLFLYYPNQQQMQTQNFANTGIDALHKNFNAQYLHQALQNSVASIKACLLNQKIVAGIGNIYASEVLYYSNINPTKSAKTLTLHQCGLIVKHTKLVLQKAINNGGSTLKDYKNASGKAGGFQNHFAVYGKANTLCKACLQHNISSNIVKIVQNQRSSFFCPHHQV